MIAVVFFISARGEVILARPYRQNHSIRALSELFRNELIATQRIDQCPVNYISDHCFVHLKLTDMYLVLVATDNANSFMCLQYGIRLLQTIQAYFGAISETRLKDNFAAVLEIMDETVDFGYPQLTESEALQTFITATGMRSKVVKNPHEAVEATARLMGATPWRREGLIYRVNEVFVEVIEAINVLVSKEGEVLQQSVTGRIVVKNFLSGTPECELLFDNPALAEGSTSGGMGEALAMLDNVSFHPCVKVSHFAKTNTVPFVPPDGEFTLMRYYSSAAVQPPLRAVSPTVHEVSRTRTELSFRLRATLGEKESLNQVEVRIPCPENTSSVSSKTDKGHASYSPNEHAVVWRLAHIANEDEIGFTCEIKQIATTDEQAGSLWSRPPLHITFEYASHSFTGLHITQLKVREPVFLYEPNKWIRYTGMAGQYQCRI